MDISCLLELVCPTIPGNLHLFALPLTVPPASCSLQAKAVHLVEILSSCSRFYRLSLSIPVARLFSIFINSVSFREPYPFVLEPPSIRSEVYFPSAPFRLYGVAVAVPSQPYVFGRFSISDFSNSLRIAAMNRHDGSAPLIFRNAYSATFPTHFVEHKPSISP